jgi:Flp pilus assembly protein TadB
MFSSPVFYGWLAWLLALAVFAVMRYKARQREEQQREERRQQREAQRRQHSDGAVRRQARRSALPTDYRDQLVAAGIIRPAAEPDITPDPATSM